MNSLNIKQIKTNL